MTPAALYLITGREWCASRRLVDVVAEAIRGGVQFVQYREKTLGIRARHAEARALRDVTRAAGVTYIVNDDVDLALAVEADGVHLGQEDLPVAEVRTLVGTTFLIGASTHTLEEARAAEAAGANYLAVGPIFESPTKMTRPALGPTALTTVKTCVGLPLYAIGGVTEANVQAAIRAGADGVAVISAILGAQDIQAAAAGLLARLQAARP